MTYVENILRECRNAACRLSRTPAFVVAVVLSLAVGISADVRMVSVVDAIFFRPPAHVADVDRLVEVRVRTYPDYVDLRDQARSFTGVAGYFPFRYAITDRGIATPVSAMLVSQNLLPLLGVHPALGRFFLPDEDRPGGPHVAVLGYSLWQNRFGGARDVVGRTVHVAGDLYTIVGVAPDGFTGPALAPVDLLIVAARAMRALLFGISPLSPAVYVLGAALLFGMAMLATVVPARRAVRIEPTIALRTE